MSDFAPARRVQFLRTRFNFSDLVGGADINRVVEQLGICAVNMGALSTLVLDQKWLRGWIAVIHNMA